MISVCAKCDKETSRCICTKVHQQQQYSNDSPFRCPHCTKTFAKRPYLVLHQKTHDKDIHSCNTCQVCFSTRDILERHKCWKNEKLATCSNCGREVSKNSGSEVYCTTECLQTKGTGDDGNIVKGECKCSRSCNLVRSTNDLSTFLCHDCDKSSDKIKTDAHTSAFVQKSVEQETTVQNPDDDHAQSLPCCKKKRAATRKTLICKDVVKHDESIDSDEGEIQRMDVPSTSEQYVMDLSHKPVKHKETASEQLNLLTSQSEKSESEENNNKHKDESKMQDDVFDLSIAKQPLIKNLSMLKTPNVGKRGTGEQIDSTPVAVESEKEKYDDPEPLQPGHTVKVKKQKLIHSITDKLTEAIIDDLDDHRPLDLTKDSATRRDVVHSSSEQTEEATPELTPVRRTEDTRIHIPIIKGTVDSAIEEELLKFYGQAITYIGLTVYKEHEKELYGHNLSQVGLFNAGHGSDIMSHEQKRP